MLPTISVVDRYNYKRSIHEGVSVRIERIHHDIVHAEDRVDNIVMDTFNPAAAVGSFSCPDCALFAHSAAADMGFSYPGCALFVHSAAADMDYSFPVCAFWSRPLLLPGVVPRASPYSRRGSFSPYAVFPVCRRRRVLPGWGPESLPLLSWIFLAERRCHALGVAVAPFCAWTTRVSQRVLPCGHTYPSRYCPRRGPRGQYRDGYVQSGQEGWSWADLKNQRFSFENHTKTRKDLLSWGRVRCRCSGKSYSFCSSWIGVAIVFQSPPEVKLGTVAVNGTLGVASGVIINSLGIAEGAAGMAAKGGDTVGGLRFFREGLLEVLR